MKKTNSCVIELPWQVETGLIVLSILAALIVVSLGLLVLVIALSTISQGMEGALGRLTAITLQQSINWPLAFAVLATTSVRFYVFIRNALVHRLESFGA